MAGSQAKQERIKALVAELLAEEEAEGEGFDPKHENINDIEDAMVRIGDMVAREFGMQKLARHTGQVCQHPQCPDCGQVGERVGEQARDLITRRGKVALTETKY